MATSEMNDYTLYSYFRSSCSARLRIVLHFKGLKFETKYVNLLKGEQNNADHILLNPSATVPVLICHRFNGLTLGQSIAALEFLEQAHPDPPLLPSTEDIVGRANVRVLLNIIACDIQPVTNSRILHRVKELGGDAQQWARTIMSDGLWAYEMTARKTAGIFSVGDTLSLADCALAPAVWNAERYGVDMDKYPTIQRIFARLSGEQAVLKAHWQAQEDTPTQLRHA